MKKLLILALVLLFPTVSSAVFFLDGNVPPGCTVSAGVLTCTGFIGDGSSLTGLSLDGNDTEINRLATAVKANAASPVAGTTGTFSGEVSAGSYSTTRTTSAQKIKLYEGTGDGDNQVTITAGAMSDNATLDLSGGNASFGALNLVTTGTISGAIPMATDDSGNATLTAAQQYGYFHWQGDAGTVILAGAAAGMSLCVYSTGANAVKIRPEASDVIVLNGAANSAREAIVSASAAGDFVCLIAKDATNWYTLGRSGTWTAEVP